MATTTTDLAARAKSADAAIFERAAERVQRLDCATALFHPLVPRVLDLNAVRLDARLDAAEAAALVERAQAGLPHRRLEVHDEALGERLAPDLAERGWTLDRLLLMGRDGGAPAPDAAAEEVPYGHVRGLDRKSTRLNSSH